MLMLLLRLRFGGCFLDLEDRSVSTLLLGKVLFGIEDCLVFREDCSRTPCPEMHQGLKYSSLTRRNQKVEHWRRKGVSVRSAALVKSTVDFGRYAFTQFVIAR